MKQRFLKFSPAFTYCIAYALILHCLFFYGFVRDGLWFVIAVLLIPLARRMGAANMMTLAISFGGITALLLAGASLWNPTDRIYKDPASKFSTIDSDGLPNYKKNQVEAMLQPFGDLKRIAHPSTEFEIEPRQVRFKTDGFGFRNEQDYHGQRFVLVGDSFTLGSGNTQEENLTGQLKRDYKVDTYNLAFPTDIKGYIQNIEKFRDEYGSNFKVLLFVYEGNDFTEKENWLDKNGYHRLKWTTRRWLKAYKRFFWDTALYRFTYFAYGAIKNKNEKETRVEVLQLGKRKVAISRGYTEVARRKNYQAPAYFYEGLKDVQPFIAHIFFIPAKYRVIKDLLPAKETLPNRQWATVRELGERLGIPATNLTEPLRQATLGSFKKDESLPFWTDDTHWNPRGIAIAAREVCKAVPELSCKPAS